MSDFNLRNFTRSSLIDGVKNGVFAKEQANIWAVNYFTKGILGEADIEQIATEVAEWEEQKRQAENPPAEETEEPAEDEIPKEESPPEDEPEEEEVEEENPEEEQ